MDIVSVFNLVHIQASAAETLSAVIFIGAGLIGIAAIWTLLTLMKPILDGIKM